MPLIDLNDRMCEAILACEKVLDPKTPGIPSDLIAACRGVAFLTNYEARFGVSASGGSGLIVHRDSISGKWSHPCALNTGGAGLGFSVGVGVRDIILVFMDDAPIKQLTEKSDVKLTGQYGISAGPLGDDVLASLDSVGMVFSYSYNEGVFAGIGMEATGLSVNKRNNKAYYKSDATAEDILFQPDSVMTPDAEAAKLLRTLHHRLEEMSKNKESS